MLIRIYNKLITDFSKITLFLLSLVLITSIFYSKNFNLDASSDALLLEGDQDLKFGHKSIASRLEANAADKDAEASAAWRCVV